MSAISCFGSFRSRLQKIISRTDSRSARESARGVGGGLQAEFFRGVGVQQIRLQHAVFDDHRAPGGDAFAIEGRGAEAADHGAVVDHGDLVAGDLLAQLACQE